MSPPAGVVDGLLAGRYRLVARLGTGGNGEVWHARDERLDRDVAVKVLRPELADDEDVRARFRAEARHAGGLRHPGIATVFDFAEDDEGAWLVMELVDGQPLSDVLRQEGRLPVDRTLDVVEQAAAALQAAHAGGVVHRDVKPGNLLLRRDGRLVVTDFGIAYAAGAAHLTRTGQVVGTASYLSPEQASGGPVSGATDLYALGVVAHECLSGARPFERDEPVAVLLAQLQTPPPPLPPDVPEPVADLVHRMMAKDPAARPASAAQVEQEAAALRHAQVPVAPAPPAAAPTAVLPAATTAQARPAVLGLAGRPGQRRAVRATAVALGLLAIALGVRDATEDDPAPARDVRQEAPDSSTPPAPVATPDSPVVQPQDGQEAPAVEPQDDQEAPAQEAPAQEAPAQEQGDQGGQDEQQPLDEQQRKELEKQQEQQRKELEKQQEQQRKDQEQADEEQEKGKEQQEGKGPQGRGGDG